MENNNNQPALTDAERKEIIQVITGNASLINESFTRSFTLHTWFRAYVQSEDFVNLREDWRGRAFETYRELSSMLEVIDTYTSKFIK